MPRTEDASDDRLRGMELGPDGNVHAASWADEVIKISPDGTVVWRAEADGRVATRPC